MNQIIKNSTLNIISKLINAIVQFISLPILLRIFGKDEYGLIILATSLNTFITILQLGIPTSMPKFIAEWLTQKKHSKLIEATRTISSLYISISLINFLIIIYIAYFNIDTFKIPSEQHIILQNLLLITAITSLFSIPATLIDQILYGAQEIGYVSLLDILKNFIYLFFVVFIFLTKSDISVYFFYTIRCLFLFLTIPLKLKKLAQHTSLKVLLPGPKKQCSNQILKHSISLMSFTIFSIIFDKITPIVLSIRTTSKSSLILTQYEALNNIRIFLIMIASSVVLSLVPHISATKSNYRFDFCNILFTTTTKFVWSAGALLGFGIIMLSKEIILLYVGDSYLNTKLWLEVLALAFMYNLYNPVLSSIIISYGKFKPLIIGTGIGSIIGISILWFFTPIIGIGAYPASLLAFNIFIFLVTHFFYFPKNFKFNGIDQIKNIFLPPFFCGIIMLFFTKYILDYIGSQSLITNIIIGITVGTTTYAILIYNIYLKSEIKLFINKLNIKNKYDPR